MYLLSKYPFKLLIFVTFLISSGVNAQYSGTLRGVVTDSTSGESLAYGNVFIRELNIGASTDARGYFLIRSIPAGAEYTLIVSYVGYNTKIIPVQIVEDRLLHIDIKLSPSSVELQTIEKVGEKVAENNATDIGLQRIAIRDLEALPKGVETDIFRSLQYMAGVRTTSDVSARYYVRGSSSNQNLVLLEGTTIYNPFHALGLFSAVDPEIINNIEFYKGGYTSEYGGRIASVLSILPKEGNKNRYSGSAGLSMLTGKMVVEGPIPNGSFIMSARKSYSTSILNKFLNESNLPISFYDVFFKANYSNLDDATGSKYTIYGFLSSDDILYNNPMRADYSWDNSLYGFKWFYVGDSPLYIELGISHSKFEGKVNPNNSKIKPQLNRVNDTSVDANFNYIFKSRDEIVVGIQIKDIRTVLEIENLNGIESNIGKSGTNISAFAKYKFLRFDNFGLDIGARATLTRLAGGGGSESLIEPRISLTYRLLSFLTLKAAYGQYRQDMTTLSDETDIISIYEPWLIVPDYLNVSRSNYFSAGLEVNQTGNFTFETEVYYKKIKNIVTLNREQIYLWEPDFVNGSGESYGLEIMSTFSPSIFRFTAAYTLAWAFKEVSQWVYYPKYDSRNTFNIALELNLGSGWNLSTVWNYSSGLPFTQVTGFYSKVYINDPNFPSNVVNSLSPYSILGDLNLARLPDYHRLDFSVSKRFQMFSIDFDLSLNILNVYDRKNLFYLDRSTGERVNSLPFLPTVSLRGEI